MATNVVHVLYLTMYLSVTVGGDRVGGAVVREKATGEGAERGIPLVLGVLEAVMYVHLDLLVTDVCSEEMSASCVRSPSELQWSHGERVNTEVSEGTHCMDREEMTTNRLNTTTHPHTQLMLLTAHIK